jgi:hypothetical protein
MPVDELAALLRVVTVVADLDPATAWELDAQLDGLTKVTATFAEGLSTWGERLTAIGLHDSVTAAAATGSDHLAQTAAAFAAARRSLRTVYAAQFAAAEAHVRQVERRDFWGETAGGASGSPTAPAGPPPAGGDREPAGVPADDAAGTQPGAMNLSGGGYVDWSCDTGDGGRTFEVGYADGNAVNINLTEEQLRELRDQLDRTLAGDDAAMPLVSTEDGGYIDWSTKYPGGDRQLELGDEHGNTVLIDLTPNQLRDLQQQLAEDIAEVPATTGAAGETSASPGAQPTPAVEPAAPGPAVPEPGRSSEEIRPPNGAPGVDQGFMHFNSALGRLWNALGDDQHLQVDGHALGNVITDLGAGITLHKHDTNHALRELRRIRTQLPDGGRAARCVDRAIERLDAPDRPAPALPDAAPAELKDLVAELNRINLVRRGNDDGQPASFHEDLEVAAATERWLRGDLTRWDFERELRGIAKHRHESSEGYTEIKAAFNRIMPGFRQWARRPD